MNNYTTPIRARTTGSHIKNNNALSVSRSGQYSPATDRRTPGRHETMEHVQIVQRFTEALPEQLKSFDFDSNLLLSKQGPSTKVFEHLLRAAISMIDENWHANLSSSELHIEVPQFLKFIECPVSLKKSDMVAPHSNWPRCLSVLAHLCQIAMDEDFDDECYVDMTPLEGEMFHFSREYFSHWDPYCENSDEEMARELESVLKQQLDIVQSEHSREIKQEELLSKKAEAHENKIIEVKNLQKRIYEMETTIIHSAKQNLSDLGKEYELTKEEKQNEYRKICGMRADLKALEDRESELRKIVETQDVSQDDAREMKRDIEKMDISRQEVLDLLEKKELPLKQELEQKLAKKKLDIQRKIDVCNRDLKEIRSKLPSVVEGKLEDMRFIEKTVVVSPSMDSVVKNLKNVEDEIKKHINEQTSKNQELDKKFHILQKSENNKIYEKEQQKCKEIKYKQQQANEEHEERMKMSDQENNNLWKHLEALRSKIRYQSTDQGKEPDIKEEYERACSYNKKVIEICEAKELSVNECVRRLDSAIASLEQETMYFEQQAEKFRQEEQENMQV
eukprot:GHVP01065393.1.p4 GENE.GHVP01065393.1~~GHVP01065393.1.p4  ORF type:complete len:562 (-),score=129.94 GHVP01065393.1:7012-8697(-)